MNGQVFPPIGQRERMQFQTIDRDATVKTYSRGCTVKRGDFVLVRVPMTVDGDEDRSKLSPDDLRFVEHNITPAEWAAGQKEAKES